MNELVAGLDRLNFRDQYNGDIKFPRINQMTGGPCFDEIEETNLYKFDIKHIDYRFLCLDNQQIETYMTSPYGYRYIPTNVCRNNSRIPGTDNYSRYYIVVDCNGVDCPSITQDLVFLIVYFDDAAGVIVKNVTMTGADYVLKSTDSERSDWDNVSIYDVSPTYEYPMPIYNRYDARKRPIHGDFALTDINRARNLDHNKINQRYSYNSNSVPHDMQRLIIRT
jgi:hypothetical protein